MSLSREDRFWLKGGALREDDVAVRLVRQHVPGGARGLLERSDELLALGGSLAQVTDSRRGRVVLVGGEAGIGKTTLLRAFCEELGDSARVLWAACDPLFTPRPLGPLLDVARVTDGELRAEVERGAKPHDVAAAVMRELESPAPTVMVLEDVHWADEATLDVVRLVSRRVESVPALLVASYRDDELDRSHPLRAVLGQLPGGEVATRLELSGLSRAAVAELAQGSEVDVDQLYDRTVGNPFFVTEVLAAGEDRVPPTVRDAVLTRLAPLSAAARTLLDAVAIVPEDAEMWLLDRLTKTPPGTMEECLRSGILRADAARVAFRHELARLAVEESLAPDWRLELHRRALAALTEPAIGAPDLVRLAHHAEAAADRDAVLRFAPVAAAQAAAVEAHREAADQYARALRFAHAISPVERADLLERFAGECFLTDMREAALVALDDALVIRRNGDDMVALGETQRLRARLLPCLGRASEARTAALDALTLLQHAPPGRELARTYAQLAEIAGRADEREDTISWGTRAIELAEQVGDTEALALALQEVGAAECLLGLRGGREKVERSIALATDAGLPLQAGEGYITLCAVLSRQREWRQIDPVLEAGSGYCREHGLEAWLGYLSAWKADGQLARGHWSEAAETATSLLATPISGVIGPHFRARLTLARVWSRRGNPECWPLLDEALAVAQRVGELSFLVRVVVPRAEAVWLEGRPEAIAAETDQAFALATQLGEPYFLGELALWRWRAGLLSEAPAQAEELSRLQIAGEWRRVATSLREHGNRYDAALALADSDDEQTLRQAYDELRALGATPAATIVARRLRQRGARGLPRGPRPTTQANAAGLTARELEVVPLLADGLRDTEIAARLVISERTVNHHVSAILRKLNVRTRGEAIAAAARLGLLPP